MAHCIIFKRKLVNRSDYDLFTKGLILIIRCMYLNKPESQPKYSVLYKTQNANIRSMTWIYVCRTALKAKQIFTCPFHVDMANCIIFKRKLVNRSGNDLFIKGLILIIRCIYLNKPESQPKCTLFYKTHNASIKSTTWIYIYVCRTTLS